MPEIRVTGEHPVLAAGDVRHIVGDVLHVIKQNSHLNDGTVYARLLTGGFSGSLVALVSAPEMPPLIVKAGPLTDVESELESRRNHTGDDAELAKDGLEGLISTLEIEVEAQIVRWGVICYHYVGGLSFAELEHYSDMAKYLKDFVSESDRDRAPSETSVRACLRETAEALTRKIPLTAERNARSLSSYLRPVAWDKGIRAGLIIAASLWPDVSELENFERWFQEGSDAIAVAPVADSRQLHGDARLANILIDSVHARVHLIDFGNGRTGHVFEDLARFELDLILATARRYGDGSDLIQDELLQTFTSALRDGFGLWDLQTSLRSERCLKLWREELAGVLPGTALPGMAMMYRWFLLGECLSRLRWIGTNGASAAGADAPSILRMICALRARLNGNEGQYLPVSTSSDGLRALHCIATFVPVRGNERSVNEKRNVVKRGALQSAARRSATVRLLGETGQSYLSTRGVFSSPVRELLSAGGSFQAVISNPSFLEAYGISASFEADPRRGHDWRDSPSLNEDLRNKIGESIRGYQVLRDTYGGLVEVRAARFGIGGTMLLTDEEYFYEPYFRTFRNRRHAVLFDTFEMQFQANSLHIHTLVRETFEFHWEQSDELDDLATMESRWGDLRSEVFKAWQDRLSWGVQNA